MQIRTASAPNGRIAQFARLMVPRIQRALNERHEAGLRTPTTPIVFGWVDEPPVHDMLDMVRALDSETRAEDLEGSFTRLGIMLPGTTRIEAERILLSKDSAKRFITAEYPDAYLRYTIHHYGRRLFDKTLKSVVETGSFAYEGIDLEHLAKQVLPHELVETSAQLDSKLFEHFTARGPIGVELPDTIDEAADVYLDEIHEQVFAYGIDALVSWGRRLTVSSLLSNRPLELNMPSYRDIIYDLIANYVEAAVRIPGTVYAELDDGSIIPTVEHETNGVVLGHLGELETELITLKDRVEHVMARTLREHPERFALANDTATSGLEYVRVLTGTLR